MSKALDSYTFTALDDFSLIKNKARRLEAAKEFGIRVIRCKNMKKRDWRVIKGPWSFRRRAKSLLFGNDKKDSFYIRKVKAEKGSNIRLFYYSVKSGKEAIVEVDRKPGLCLDFSSGRERGIRCDVYSRCTPEYMLRFITFDKCVDVL